jgi:hypothetical protein
LCPQPKLTLEYDAVQGTSAVTAVPASEFKPGATGDWTLARAFAEIGVKVAIDQNVIPNPWPDQDPPECITLASLDQIVGCSKGAAPGQPAWYAHGLLVPWETGWTTNGVIGCVSPPGILWLAGGYCDPAPVSETEVREDFVLFAKALSGDRDKLVNGIHELSHVLNIHHCDQGAELESQGRLGSKARAHTCEARQQEDAAAPPYLHVRPGKEASPWCHMTDRHKSWHADESCCPDPPQGKFSREKVDLKVSPEKKQYCPGEPITVTVELTAGEDLKFRSEESLDPAYGYLSLWRSTGQGSYAPLQIPIYLDGKLPCDGNLVCDNLAKGKTAKMSGIPIWYGTGIDQSASFEVVASYAGFEDPRATVVSPPESVPISGDPPGRCDAVARRLFSTAEARRAAWLHGGPDGGAGLAALDSVSENHGTSVESAYANLALTLHWIQPYHYLTREGSLARRDPDRQRADVYFRRLQAQLQDQPDVLPESQRNLVRGYPRIP